MQTTLFTKIWSFIFSIALIGGGLTGYYKVGSKLSLFCGVFFGVIMLICSFALMHRDKKSAWVLSLIIAILMSLFFIYRIFQTGRFMPAAVILILSVIEIIALLYPTVRRQKHL